MNDKTKGLVAVTWDEFSQIIEGNYSSIVKPSLKGGHDSSESLTLVYDKSSELRFDSVLGVSLPSEKLRDFFAWSYTELEGLTPFNDTLRVVTLSESDLVQLPKFSKAEPDYEVWSLVILGEMLTRMKSTKSLGAVNLSWINSTFSKAAVLSMTNKWSKSQSWGRLTEAFENVSAARGESSHQSLLDEMIPVWNLVSSATKDSFSSSLRDPKGFTLHFSKSLVDAGVLVKSDIKELLAIVSMFSFDSDSVETRLLGFDEMVQRFENKWHDKRRKSFWAIVLGLGASFVGRGPSHLHLLDATPSAPGSRFMWAALIAQYSEKGRLPERWSKTTKQIARELSGQAKLGWGNGYDLGRHEFEWLCHLPQIIDFENFRGLRSSAGTMLIELLPGVTFQVRTGSSEKPSKSKQQLRVSQEFEVVKETLSVLQNQFAILQRRVGVSESQAGSPRSRKGQQKLFED